jgi:hypothetical protein
MPDLDQSVATDSEQQTLIGLLKEAKRLDREAAVTKHLRDESFKRIVEIVGGDMFMTIYNAERRIGFLMTEDD